MSDSKYIHKRHNVSVLIYHLVCPTKYRRVIFEPKVENFIKDICLELENRYEIAFLEIGFDGDHAHFLIQSVPMYSPTKIAKTVKSLTAREVFKEFPELKKKLWGGEFWSKGYFISTVGKHGDEEMLKNYVRNQGEVNKNYKPLYQGQLQLF